ncbi:MAG TPA: hypothetical protein VLE50_06625, partial [Cellvibrio sp.]|nr:hypothetical protein [Cellvibrio sp.]
MTTCSVKQLVRLVLFFALFCSALSAAQTDQENNLEPELERSAAEDEASASSAPSQPLPKAESINLGEVIPELQPPKEVAASSAESSSSMSASSASLSSSIAASSSSSLPVELTEPAPTSPVADDIA